IADTSIEMGRSGRRSRRTHGFAVASARSDSFDRRLSHRGSARTLGINRVLGDIHGGSVPRRDPDDLVGIFGRLVARLSRYHPLLALVRIDERPLCASRRFPAAPSYPVDDGAVRHVSFLASGG